MCVFSHTWNIFFLKRHEGGLFGKGKGTDVSMVRSKYNYIYIELDKKRGTLKRSRKMSIAGLELEARECVVALLGKT